MLLEELRAQGTYCQMGGLGFIELRKAKYYVPLLFFEKAGNNNTNLLFLVLFLCEQLQNLSALIYFWETDQQAQGLDWSVHHPCW